MQDRYRTVDSLSECEICVKGSRFIACVMPCPSADEMQRCIESVRSRYPGATHYCYAAVFGDFERFGDDGEPSGTAGRPILRVLRGSGLDFTAIVVVRYFGGTLLGAGGLVQAYTDSSVGAMHSAETAEMVMCANYRMELTYQQYGSLQSTCGKYIVGSIGAEFGETVAVSVSVPTGSAEGFLASAADLTKGTCVPSMTGRSFVRMGI